MKVMTSMETIPEESTIPESSTGWVFGSSPSFKSAVAKPEQLIQKTSKEPPDFNNLMAE